MLGLQQLVCAHLHKQAFHSVTTTLVDLSNKLSNVKGENARLKEENIVIEEYIENLMVKSKTFEASDL